MPAKTWGDVEVEISQAVKDGILLDKREEMPRGKGPNGETLEWKRKRLSPADILGHCIHQNGSPNFDRPLATANYHTSKKQHITPGRPLPSVCYAIMIPDNGDPAWLTGDLSWITYAQGSKDIGDENRHLVGVLVMGGFSSNGFKASWTKNEPSIAQLEALSDVCGWLCCTFDYGAEGYFSHDMFGKAFCPGKALSDWVDTERVGADGFLIDNQWQEALLRWNAQCLPKYGSDNQWGSESKSAIAQFQKAHGLSVTAFQDPFTELMLLKKYPAVPEVGPIADLSANRGSGAVLDFDVSDESPPKPTPPYSSSSAPEVRVFDSASDDNLPPPKKTRRKSKKKPKSK